MRKALGLWASKVVEHCKKNLMGHFSRIFEESSAESCVDGLWRPAQEVSEENNVVNWATDHPHYTLAKNVTTFSFPFPKNLPKPSLKGNGLISLVEISRLPNIDSATWFLVIIVIQVYTEKEQMGQKEIEKCRVWREKEQQEI